MQEAAILANNHHKHSFLHHMTCFFPYASKSEVKYAVMKANNKGLFLITTGLFEIKTCSLALCFLLGNTEPASWR